MECSSEGKILLFIFCFYFMLFMSRGAWPCRMCIMMVSFDYSLLTAIVILPWWCKHCLSRASTLQSIITNIVPLRNHDKYKLWGWPRQRGLSLAKHNDIEKYWWEHLGVQEKLKLFYVILRAGVLCGELSWWCQLFHECSGSSLGEIKKKTKTAKDF